MYMVIYVSTSPQTTAVHTSHKLSNTIITFIYIRNKSIYIHKKLANDFFFKSNISTDSLRVPLDVSS